MEETVVAHAVEKSVGSHIYSSIVTVILAITVVVLVNIISKSNTSKGSSEANEKTLQQEHCNIKTFFIFALF